MQKIFSYGTLQQMNVQLEILGKTLVGAEDIIEGYYTEHLEIKDLSVLKASQNKMHPIIYFTGNKAHKVLGTLFSVTKKDLLKIDCYEVEDYQRIMVPLKSGKKSWVYVKNLAKV